jgi:hypothetical protein
LFTAQAESRWTASIRAKIDKQLQAINGHPQITNITFSNISFNVNGLGLYRLFFRQTAFAKGIGWFSTHAKKGFPPGYPPVPWMTSQKFGRSRSVDSLWLEAAR